MAEETKVREFLDMPGLESYDGAMKEYVDNANKTLISAVNILEATKVDIEVQQNLSEEKKAIGRENIGAAPATVVSDIADLYTSLDSKQPLLTGTEGQVVGFDANGNAVAQDMQSDGGFDEDALADLELITLDDIHEICTPPADDDSGDTGGEGGDEPEVTYPPNTFQKVRAFQDSKEYILLFGYNGAYYCLSNEAFNDWTVKAASVSEVTSTDAQITFTTVPVLFTARASGDGFTLHNGDNNVYAYAQSNGTGLRVNTEAAAVFTVDTSEMGGFDSDEIIPKVDNDAVWLRSQFEAGNSCLKFESANTSVGIDYKDRDATYSTGFLSFILYEKIS